MKPGKRHALSGDLPPETLRPDLQPAGVLFDLFCRSYARLPDLAGEPARVAVVVAAIGHKRRIFQVTALLGPCAAGGETTPGRHLDKIRRLVGDVRQSAVRRIFDSGDGIEEGAG